MLSGTMEQVQPHKHIAYVCYAADTECAALAARLTRFLKEFRVPHQLRRKKPRTPVSLASVCDVSSENAAEELSDGKFLVLVCPAGADAFASSALTSFFRLRGAKENLLSEKKFLERLGALSASKKSLVIPVLKGDSRRSLTLAALGSTPLRADEMPEADLFRRVASSLLEVEDGAPWEAWEKHRKPHHVLRAMLLGAAGVGVAAVAFAGGIYFAPQGEAQMSMEEAARSMDTTTAVAVDYHHGSVHRTYERDAQGRVLSVSCFDAEGMPCPDSRGVCRTEYSYDAQGHVTSQRFFDEDGKPCCCVQGFAAIRTVYDERGMALRQSYYDQHGRPTYTADGYVEVAWSYDERGNMLSQRYLDAEGEPCEGPAGYATLRLEYDAAGHMVSQRFFNEKDELVRCASGFAEVRSRYDAAGNLLEERFFNAIGDPCVNEEGVFGYRYGYDAQGVRISAEGMSAE